MGSDAIGDDCPTCRVHIFTIDPVSETIERAAAAIKLKYPLTNGYTRRTIAEEVLRSLRSGDRLPNDCMVKTMADYSDDQHRLFLYEDAIAKDQVKLKEAREIITKYVECEGRWTTLMKDALAWLK